jgi:hypothetical protein
MALNKNNKNYFAKINRYFEIIIYESISSWSFIFIGEKFR